MSKVHIIFASVCSHTSAQPFLFPGPAPLLGTTPALEAPVPATGTVTFLLTPRALFTEFMIGMTETLANHGVAHTVNMSRSGNSAFVMAYAVANLPSHHVSQGPTPYILTGSIRSLTQPQASRPLPLCSTTLLVSLSSPLSLFPHPLQPYPLP